MTFMFTDRECGLAHKTLIFLLDEFDLFAQVCLSKPPVILIFNHFGNIITLFEVSFTT